MHYSTCLALFLTLSMKADIDANCFWMEKGEILLQWTRNYFQFAINETGQCRTSIEKSLASKQIQTASFCLLSELLGSSPSYGSSHVEGGGGRVLVKKTVSNEKNLIYISNNAHFGAKIFHFENKIGKEFGKGSIFFWSEEWKSNKQKQSQMLKIVWLFSNQYT